MFFVYSHGVYPDRDTQVSKKTGKASRDEIGVKMPYSNTRTYNAHPEDVKAEVRKKVGSLAALARAHGVSDSVVRAALIRPQPTGNKIIAECLNVPVNKLWPEWYTSDGKRLPQKTTR